MSRTCGPPVNPNCPPRFLNQRTNLRDDCCEKTWRDRSNEIIANYWLDTVYSEEEAEAHREADLHIHDLDCLTGYCAGWSLRQLLDEGVKTRACAALECRSQTLQQLLGRTLRQKTGALRFHEPSESVTGRYKSGWATTPYSLEIPVPTSDSHLERFDHVPARRRSRFHFGNHLVVSVEIPC